MQKTTKSYSSEKEFIEEVVPKWHRDGGSKSLGKNEITQVVGQLLRVPSSFFQITDAYLEQREEGRK